MFRRLHSDALQVTFEFDGEQVRAAADDNVAAALLAHGAMSFRSSVVSDSPRAPYCMIGACFECLVEIDGRPNRQACLTKVRDGMQVRRQRGAAGVNADEQDAS